PMPTFVFFHPSSLILHPFRAGPFVYRPRTPAPQAGGMGSIPIRATGQVVEAADTRRLERRAFGRGSSTLPLVTAEWTGVWPQHGLISRLTPVQIRPPQLKG